MCVSTNTDTNINTNTDTHAHVTGRYVNEWEGAVAVVQVGGAARSTEVTCACLFELTVIQLEKPATIQCLHLDIIGQ